MNKEKLAGLDTCGENMEFSTKFADMFLNAALDDTKPSKPNRNRSGSKLKRTTITLQLGKM